ncbi:LysM peptidoglycan-binding domain-containing protein [Vibrio aestuarianus]|uniref:LysM peptidoglycan-binding domain-containing protein n=1 Tax=Vibrio aestuarianus TaxID=28171 RepID=A0ABD7YK28_9VIBR|nr:LysM peptidoglycan-binding domain-containing protein [Vibrio aestuarianus]WGK85385.1 LysM peptidoglycan-binding domain-containing protein [Vibrio aestuarianus]CAH8232577.1 putative protein containing LysM domain [Vibrio aestuarianus]
MSSFIRHFALICWSLFWAGYTLAVDEIAIKIKPDAPKTYVVEDGDTLWGISTLYLDTPWQWPQLWQMNPSIENPHLIYPGDQLVLIWQRSQPQLSVKPRVKQSPQVRVLAKRALPIVEESLLLRYLHTDRLVEKQIVQRSQRVLGASSGHRYLTAQEPLYISGKQNHSRWGIYRQVGQFVRDDETIPSNEMIALRLIATAELAATQHAYSELTITALQQEIRLSDIALPETEGTALTFATTFYPSPSPRNSVAHILGPLTGGDYAGQNQVVVIDRGAQDQLRQGSMFDLRQEGAVVPVLKEKNNDVKTSAEDEIQLPSNSVGSLMVLHCYEYFSLALITNSRIPISRDILAVSPLVSEASSESESKPQSESAS